MSDRLREMAREWLESELSIQMWTPAAADSLAALLARVEAEATLVARQNWEAEVADRQRAESQVAALREALESLRHKVSNRVAGDYRDLADATLADTATAAAEHDERVRAEERERVTRAFAKDLADAFEKDGRTYSADCIRRALKGEPPFFEQVAAAIRALSPGTADAGEGVE